MTKKYTSDKGMQKLFEGFNRFLNESEGDIRTEYGHQWKYEGDDGGNELYTHMGSGRMIKVRGADPTVGMKSWLEKNGMQIQVQESKKRFLNENVPPEHLISRQDMLPALIQWVSGLKENPFRMGNKELIELMLQIQKGAAEPCKLTWLFEEWGRIPKEDKLRYGGFSQDFQSSEIHRMGLEWAKHYPKC